MKLLWVYLIATAIFFAIDMVWIGFVARSFYKEKLGYLLAEQPRWAAAIIFYLIYIGGILFFAVVPALREQVWTTALVNGAVLGLLCYATYDLTNLATIARFPVVVVIVDILWGIFLTAAVSTITFLIGSRIG
ncbi:MAG: DUF2177 family protein [Bacteroidetes bacterium]|nr:DUF2177 family protein [Bacteroidota bacterium]